MFTDLSGKTQNYHQRKLVFERQTDIKEISYSTKLKQLFLLEMLEYWILSIGQ